MGEFRDELLAEAIDRASEAVGLCGRLRAENERLRAERDAYESAACAAFAALQFAAERGRVIAEPFAVVAGTLADLERLGGGWTEKAIRPVRELAGLPPERGP